MAPTDKIALAREFSIGSWLLSGYKNLVQREAVISKDDAQKVEWVNANELWAIREQWRTRSSNPSDYDLDKALRGAFSHEFDLIKANDAFYLTQKEKEQAAILKEVMAKAAKEAAEEEERAAKQAAAYREEQEKTTKEQDRLKAEAAAEVERVKELEQELEVRRKRLATRTGGPVSSSESETDDEVRPGTTCGQRNLN